MINIFITRWKLINIHYELQYRASSPVNVCCITLHVLQPNNSAPYASTTVDNQLQYFAFSVKTPI